MKTFLTFSLLLFIGLTAKSQFTVANFEDNYLKPEGGNVRDVIFTGNGFIVAGNFFDQFKYNPSVIKIDTDGNVLWSTSEFDTTDYIQHYLIPQTSIDIEMDADSNLYATINSDVELEGYYHHCMRINPETGEIIWNKRIYGPDVNNVFNSFITDLTDTTIAVSFFSTSPSHENIMILEKSDGETLHEKNWYTNNVFSGQHKVRNMNFDTDKNLYYTAFDTLYKFYALDFDSLLWKHQITNPSEDLGDELVEWITNVYLDDDGKLFIMGTQGPFINQGFVAGINPDNGDILWFSGSGISMNIGDFSDIGTDFIISWQHKYVSGNKWYKITDVKKIDGAFVWNISFETDQDFDPGCYGSSAALAIDLDDAYIYATGYFDADNWDPGNWANVKFSLSDGEEQYEIDVDNECSNLSSGYFVKVAGDRAYYIGNLTTNDPIAWNRVAELLVTDKYSGEILEAHPFGGIHQFQSYVINMTPFDSGMFVLKQIGKKTVLEKYNADKILGWKKELSSSGFLYGNELQIGNDETIWVSAHGYQETMDEPFYADESDSIFIFRFEMSGSLIEQSSYQSISNFPADMEVSGDTANLFLSIAGNLFLKRYANGIFSALTLIDNRPEYAFPAYFNFDFLNNEPGNKLGAFSFISLGSGCQVLEIDKSTYAISVVDTLSAMDIVYNNLQLSDSTELLSGTYFDDESSGALVLYDYKNNYALWSMHSTPGFITKSVIDTLGEFIYSAGISPMGLYPLYHIYKTRMSDGAIIWQKEFDLVDPLLGDYENIDIAYDAFNNIIICALNQDTSFAGIEQIRFPVIKLFDTTGLQIQNIRMEPEGAGEFRATHVRSWHDGISWIGGNYDINQYYRAGFISELDTVYTYPEIITDSCSAFFTYETDAAYNTTFTNLSEGSDSSEIVSYSWDFCDGGTSTEINPVYTYAIPSICACLTITDAIGCSDTYCVNDDLNIQNGNMIVEIFPNPIVDNELFINTNGRVIVTGIYDITGKPINYSMVENNSQLIINMSDACDGLYYINMESDCEKFISFFIKTNK